MNPKIGKVKISAPKPDAFIAEMTPDIDVYELYESLEEGAQKLARALLGGTRTRDKRLCDRLYSCLAAGKECNLPMCPFCVQRLRISLALAVRKSVGPLLLRSELPTSFFTADLPGQYKSSN